MIPLAMIVLDELLDDVPEVPLPDGNDAVETFGPLFSAKLVRWSEHPVLSKPPVIRGIIPTDGSPARVDMSVGDQLRQRAAMGGERERAELAAFEALLSKCIADALVAEVRKEADAHGVDVLTWLTRDRSTDE